MPHETRVMNEWKTSACGGINTNVYHRRPRGLNVARRTSCTVRCSTCARGVGGAKGNAHHWKRKKVNVKNEGQEGGEKREGGQRSPAGRGRSLSAAGPHHPNSGANLPKWGALEQFRPAPTVNTGHHQPLIFFFFSSHYLFASQVGPLQTPPAQLVWATLENHSWR